RPARRQHHGFLQAVQRQDAERSRRDDFPGPRHHLHGPLLHVRVEDAARFRPAPSRCGNRQGFSGTQSQQSRQSYQEAGRRNRQDQACRSQHHQSGLCGPYRHGHGSQYGSGSRGSLGSHRRREIAEVEMTKKSGKHVENARKKVEARPYKLAEAAELLKKTHHTKFNETVELAINRGVDPKHSDQVVRGTVVLPNGLGKSVRVLVLAGGDKQREAQEAGAEFVGGDDMVQKIMEGWTDFDAVIATPDMMRSAGKLGKVLGPRGLMPNPKTGTVTADVTKAVKETKAGKVEFRVDKAGIIHCPVGKINFDAPKLAENAHSVIAAVLKAKPAAAKGKYVKKITLTSTMGPGILVDIAEAETLATAATRGEKLAETENNNEEEKRKAAGSGQAENRAREGVHRDSHHLPGHHRRTRHQAPPRRAGRRRQISGCQKHSRGTCRHRHTR